jgi:hypothetical protein
VKRVGRTGNIGGRAGDPPLSDAEGCQHIPYNSIIQTPADHHRDAQGDRHVPYLLVRSARSLQLYRLATDRWELVNADLALGDAAGWDKSQSTRWTAEVRADAQVSTRLGFRSTRERTQQGEDEPVAITTIRSIANLTDVIYTVQNLERPGDTGGEGEFLAIEPRGNIPVRMWIPWCDNQGDYNANHRIAFDSLGTIEQPLSGGPDQATTPSLPFFAVWQSGDYVFYAVDDVFDHGRLVPGNCTIGGERSVEITATGVRFY